MRLFLFEDENISFIEGLAKLKEWKMLWFIDKYGRGVVPLIYENIPYSFLRFNSKSKMRRKWDMLIIRRRRQGACLATI